MRKRHGNAILVASVYHMVVADAASGLCDILHTALVSPLDVVTEGEKRIRTERHLCVLSNPCLLFLARERLGLLGEELFPDAILQHIFVFVADIDIDGIVAVGPANVFLEWQRHHLRALAQPPLVGLAARQTGAMDAALLTGSDADGLPVFHVAHRVALCVLQRDERNDEIAHGLGRESLVTGGNIPEECRVVEFHLVAPLFERDAVHLLALNGGGLEVRIYLDDIVSAFALGLQYLYGLGSIIWSYHTVAHLALDEPGCGCIAGVAQCHEVTV